MTTPQSCRTTRYFAASSGRSLAAIVAASSPLLHARTDTTLHRTMPARAREDTHDGYRRPCVRRTARHRASGCLRRLPKGIKGDTTVHLRMRVLTTKDFRCALLRTAFPLSRRNSLRTYTYPTSLRTTVASRARVFGCLGGALPMHMHEHRRCASVTHSMNKRDRRGDVIPAARVRPCTTDGCGTPPGRVRSHRAPGGAHVRSRRIRRAAREGAGGGERARARVCGPPCAGTARVPTERCLL